VQTGLDFKRVSARISTVLSLPFSKWSLLSPILACNTSSAYLHGPFPMVQNIFLWVDKNFRDSFSPRNSIFNGEVIDEQVGIEPLQFAEAEVDEVKDGRLDGPHGLSHVDVKLNDLGAAGGQGFDHGEMESRPQIKLKNMK